MALVIARRQIKFKLKCSGFRSSLNLFRGMAPLCFPCICRAFWMSAVESHQHLILIMPVNDMMQYRPSKGILQFTLQMALNGIIFYDCEKASIIWARCWFFNLIDWVLLGTNTAHQISLDLSPNTAFSNNASFICDFMISGSSDDHMLISWPWL